MSRYFCLTKCFHRNRLWMPGEEFHPTEGENVPHHFEKVGNHDEPVAPVKSQGPLTMSEMNGARVVPLNTMTTMSEFNKIENLERAATTETSNTAPTSEYVPPAPFSSKKVRGWPKGKPRKSKEA